MMIQGDMETFFRTESMFQNHEDNHFPSTNPSAPCSADNFHDVSNAVVRRSMSFPGVDMSEEVRLDDDMSDDNAAPLGEKKKRLNLEQVKALEKSFELGNKLEPERKMQLAKALGLQPRQVAIWFQNRRARWKTKNLEKEFELLKGQLEVLKADNELLRAQNKKFHSELLALKQKGFIGPGPINLNNENDTSWSNVSNNSIDVNLSTTGTTSVESGLNSNYHPASSNVFPSIIGQPSVTPHILQGSLRPDFHASRIDQTTSNEGLCNMFNSVEEQPNFWPWPEQQNFHRFH